MKPVRFVFFFIVIIIILFYIRNLNKIGLALAAAVVCGQCCAGWPWRGECRVRPVVLRSWGLLLPSLLGCFPGSPAAARHMDGACLRHWSGPSLTGGTWGTGWSRCHAAPRISWVLRCAEINPQGIAALPPPAKESPEPCCGLSASDAWGCQYHFCPSCAGARGPGGGREPGEMAA